VAKIAKSRKTTKALPIAFRLRQPDLEALMALAEHYRIGRSEVIRFLLTREWAKIQAEAKHEREH